MTIAVKKNLVSEAKYALKYPNPMTAEYITIHNTIDRVRKHQDWNGKYCPHRILSEGRWDEVKAAIEAELNALGGKTTSKTSSSTPKAAGSTYTVKKGDTLSGKRAWGKCGKPSELE